MRRVEPRNAPTVINAVFNFDNFWDGRASFIFNGVNPFGFRDRLSTLKQLDNGTLRDVYLRVTNSSLASQAVGPATSNFEMSFENRTFPDVGKKLLSLRPLAKQLVHPEDSVLGSLSQARIERQRRTPGRRDRGLNVATYADMVHAAFQEAWWNSAEIIAREPNSVTKQAASTNNPRTIMRNPGRGTPMRAGAPSARQARPRPVHPGAMELLAVLGSGDPGLRGDAGRRRHAVRPVPGLQGAQGRPQRAHAGAAQRPDHLHGRRPQPWRRAATTATRCR